MIYVLGNFRSLADHRPPLDGAVTSTEYWRIVQLSLESCVLSLAASMQMALGGTSTRCKILQKLI